MFILRFLLKKVLFKRFMASCLCVRWEQNQDWRNCLVATNNLLSTFMVHKFPSHTFPSWHGCVILCMDCICIRISQYYLDTVPAQPSGRVPAIAVEQLWLYLKACIWSESTGLDMESSSWEMAPWLQLIMTSPGAFTHQPEFGSRAVAESALNSASWKMLSGPVGGSHMGTSWPQLLKRDKLRNSYSIFPDRMKQTEV